MKSKRNCNLVQFLSICILSQAISSSAGAVDVISGKTKRPEPVAKSTNPNPSTASTTSYLSKKHSFYVGLDAYSKSILKTTSVKSAAKDNLSPMQFPILLGYTYAFSKESRFILFLDYTLISESGPDSNQKETNLLLRSAYSQVFGKSDWEWKTGILFKQTKIIGEGGTVLLNNGGGQILFYSPGNTSESNIFATEVGINYFFNQKISWQSSLLIEAPLNTQKRNFSLLTGLVYEIGTY